MPWKESGLMNERLQFIGRLLQGEKMAERDGSEPWRRAECLLYC